MLARLSQRINKSKGQGGFTLIELLVVIIIIGILLAIAIPSYLKFRDRANKSAAQANVRASIPAIEAFYADNNTYAGANALVSPDDLRRGRQEHRRPVRVVHDLLHPDDSGRRSLEEDRPRLRHRDRRLPVNEPDRSEYRKGRGKRLFPYSGE